MSLTFTDMETELAARGFTISTARAGVLVNRAYQRLVGLHRWPFRGASGEGTAPLDVTDLGQIEAVTDETTQTPLQLVAYTDLLEWYGDLTTSGAPEFAYRAY